MQRTMHVHVLRLALNLSGHAFTIGGCDKALGRVLQGFDIGSWR